MTTIVKFECDCIGTVPDSNGDAYIIADCSEGEPMFRSRDMTGKTYKEIDYTEQLLKNALDAQKVQILKRALSAFGVPMFDDSTWQQLQELRARVNRLENPDA